MGLFFEDFILGQAYVGRSRTVTEADLINFAGVSWDFYPLHIDKEFAKNGMFGRRVAHGTFTFAAMTGAISQLEVFGETEALLGADGLKFIRPVFIGDTITPKFSVLGSKDHDKGGIITLTLEVSNQRMEVVMVCKVNLLIKKR